MCTILFYLSYNWAVVARKERQINIYCSCAKLKKMIFLLMNVLVPLDCLQRLTKTVFVSCTQELLVISPLVTSIVIYLKISWEIVRFKMVDWKMVLFINEKKSICMCGIKTICLFKKSVFKTILWHHLQKNATIDIDEYEVWSNPSPYV